MTRARVAEKGCEMMELLKGKCAVVTGGAQGIGLAIATAFVEAGASVVIGDRDGVAAKVAAESLGAGSGLGVACDVTDSDDVQRMIAAAIDFGGQLDVMVNNAGITGDATMRKMIEQQFDAVIAVNLKGCWNGTRHAADVMREQETGGSIINISSISGKVGLAGQTNYSAAKAGVVGLTKAAAKEVAFRNVRVNAIQPGLTRTAMTEALPEHILAEKVAGVPLGRAAEPSEIASVALFYASAMSSYMTGTVAEVTGGRFM